MLNMDAMGFIVRSRFKQTAEQEKASLFHASKESLNSRKAVSTLKIDGVCTNDDSLIEDHVTNYFTALFNGFHDVNLVNTGQSFVPDDSFLPDMLNHLTCMSRQESTDLEKEVQYDEVEYVVNKCAKNKSPGLDGLSYEFYKCTWSLIGDTFVKVIQCQLSRFRIVETNTVGATRLCPKVSGTPSVDELRPITPLNCDYKIYLKF